MTSKTCLRWHHLVNAYNDIARARSVLQGEPDMKPITDGLERPLNQLWDALEVMRNAED